MDFTYKGVTASSLGVIVNSLEWYKKPQRKVDTNRIEGKDGSTVTDDSYEPFSLNAKITLMALTNIDAIVAWLTGSGVLVFSGDSAKYRNVYIMDEVGFTQDGSVWVASFNFFVDKPFRYVMSESDVTVSGFPATYTNAGSVASKPLLKVTGTGTVVFVVNGVSITYVFDTPYVYIDCDSMDAYYLTTLKNRNLSLSAFPTFAVGSNAISITSGTITEIVITPRTRFI